MPGPQPPARTRHGRLRELVRQEDGAVSVLVALATTALLGALALAVDAGSVALAARDQQGAVDLAALDAVQALGALRPATGDPAALADQLAADSLATNAGWAARRGRSHTVELGTLDPVTGAFTPTTVEPGAVRVRATSDAPRFLPGGDSSVTRSAVAEVSELGSISIGTDVAGLDTRRGVLLDALVGGLVGGHVDLGAVGWQGLAAGSVPLRDLATELGVGSPAALLDTSVTVRELLEATAAGLSSSGDPADLAAATSLLELAAVASVATEFALADLLDLETGQVGALADAEVDALSLATASALLVDGGRLVDLGVDLGTIPGVTSGSVHVAVVEAPRIAVGRAGTDPATGTWRTLASTAQVRLALDLELDPLGWVGGVHVGSMRLPLGVDAGRGEAALESVRCAVEPTGTAARLPVATSGAGMALGAADEARLLAPDLVGSRQPLVDLETQVLGLRVPLAAVTAAGRTEVAGQQAPVELQGPWVAGADVPGATSLGLADLLPALDLDVELLGTLPLGVDLVEDVLDPALGLASPVLDVVDGEVVEPLLGALGLSLGDADVRVLDVDCGVRRLVE